jgi:hypothetical protein
MFGIGVVLIGICHLPVSFRIRGTLLLLVAGVLAAQRAGALPQPWSDAIWPILGSMFMFRLIVYFYDLRHDNAPATPARTFAYFFMLPNASFPLFPVVDYKTFRRNHYDDDTVRPTRPASTDAARHHPPILYRIVTPLTLTRRRRRRRSSAASREQFPALSRRCRDSSIDRRDAGMFGFHLPETQKVFPRCGHH